MADSRISAIVVKDKDGRMAGILSTTDLARAHVHLRPHHDLPDLLPRHLMTREVLVTWPDEALEEAVDRMLTHHVHRLVVVRDQRDHNVPVGILSLTDLAQLDPHPF